MCEVFWSKKSIMHAIFFVNFLTSKVGDDPNCQESSVSWFTMSPNAVLRKANLILQWIRLSNATLPLIVFFACGIHKLLIILRMVLFTSINQIYHDGFFPGWLQTIWKSRIKKQIILSKANFFIQKITRAD